MRYSRNSLLYSRGQCIGYAVKRCASSHHTLYTTTLQCTIRRCVHYVHITECDGIYGIDQIKFINQAPDRVSSKTRSLYRLLGTRQDNRCSPRGRPGVAACAPSEFGCVSRNYLA